MEDPRRQLLISSQDLLGEAAIDEAAIDDVVGESSMSMSAVEESGDP